MESSSVLDCVDMYEEDLVHDQVLGFLVKLSFKWTSALLHSQGGCESLMWIDANNVMVFLIGLC